MLLDKRRLRSEEEADAAAGNANGAPPRGPSASSATVGGALETAAIAREGFVVLNNVLTPKELDVLRAESSRLLAALDDGTEGEPGPSGAERVIEQGCVVDVMASCPMPEDALARTNEAAYMAARSSQLPTTLALPNHDDDAAVIRRLIFERLAALARVLLGGGEVFFFNEHYVVKPPHTKVEFRWHRDDDEQLGMCLHRPTIPPYLSLWCALDDVTETNGPLRFVPLLDPAQGSSDLGVAQLEQRATAPVCVAAGSVVAFLSHVWHCSAPNASDGPRRAYYVQYSTEPITATPRTIHALSFAIPCRHDDPQPEKNRSKRAKLDPVANVHIAFVLAHTREMSPPMILPMMLPLRMRNQGEHDTLLAQQQYTAFRPTTLRAEVTVGNNDSDGEARRGPGSLFHEDYNTIGTRVHRRNLTLYK